eukprot:CAMPEP_0119423100 /NCGR_PEP_ID=MMETSP1335-20130426/29566_1 /TAXON_ID=259385 /ORGANISM="Chrysoculter rhomboideus, Strain RCC1486" /LENGTH=64 /DNA_ID=CAMNT_0007448579 /DNA_START=121 /DNA_END=315 /DNA_ORIENTATION=-
MNMLPADVTSVLSPPATFASARGACSLATTEAAQPEMLEGGSSSAPSVVLSELDSAGSEAAAAL